MKKNKLFKLWLMAVILFAGSGVTWGQVTLPHYDPINYTIGQSLVTQTGWALVNSSTNDLLISSGNLSYTGLPTSSGNKIAFSSSGEDAAKTFTQQTSGTIYYSFLLNVTSIGSLNTTGGYFTSFVEGATTTYGCTVWTRSNGTNYDIGINPRTTAANTAWYSTPLIVGTTYHIVISYEIVSGAANDVVKMWINPTLGGTEPTASANATNSLTDLANVNRILIRQDGSSATPSIEMDELRIGTTWASVTPSATCSDPTTQASTVTFSNILSDQMTVGWTRGGTPGDGVIVVAKAGSAPDDPSDGTSYSANAAFSSGTQINTGTYVVYNGSGTSVNVTGLSPSTTYYFKVYEKNCTGTSIMINTSSPAEGNQATTAACAVNPTITSTTAISVITPTTASSGATGLTSGENCVITAKGVCWNTSANPTISNSKTSDGTGTADFTSSLTGLSAQTLYYVRAYATNGFGTAYGDEKTFRTLSTELTQHPGTFTATAASSSQINLTFSAASSITNADGYIILRRTGGAGNPGITNITDGFAPSSLTMPSGTTFVANINSTSTTTYNNTGLPNPNTQYNYAIIAYNWDGVNDETYNYYTGGTIKTVNATTLCSAINIPYTENFESVTIPAIPSCHTIENAGTGNNWITTNNPGSGFTTKTLTYQYNSTNDANAWFYSPGLNLTGGTSYRLSFKYGCASATYPEKLKVKYGSAAANASMSNSLYDNSNVINVTPNTQEIDFTPSVTGVYYMGFNAYSLKDMYNLYVDDISLQLSPTCLVPTNVTSGSVTATTATISWTASTSNPSNGYQYEVRTSGAAGSGATGLTASGTTSAGVVSTTISELAANTSYSVYVRSDCGASDYSAWTSAFSFTTSQLSAPVANNASGVSSTGFTANWGAVTGATGGYLLDVSEFANFGTSSSATLNEGFESGMPTSGYSTGTYTLGSGDWTLVDGLKVTGSGNFNTGAASCQLKASTGIATSPALNNVGTVSFYAKSPSGVTLTIKKIVNNGVPSTVTTRTITSSWAQYTVAVNDNSSSVQIVFENGSNYTLLDDVSIGYTSITPSFVTGYNAKQITGQSTISSDITGLLPNTAYYYRVRAKSANSISANSNTITAFTAFTGNTNASTLPNCPTCDIVVNNGGELNVNATKTYNKVTVKAGGKLTLASGSALTAPITIESNAENGTGTYVDENLYSGSIPAITATVNQAVTNLPRTYYTGIPVAVSSTTGIDKVATFSESADAWSALSDPGSTTMPTPGQGYLIQVFAAVSPSPEKTHISFTGTLNTGDKGPIALTVDKKKFNFLGNPYPSYLDGQKVVDASTLVEKSIWFRGKDGSAYQFSTYNTPLGIWIPASASVTPNATNNGFIPPMQGFWLKATSAGNYTFTNAMRTHNTTGSAIPLKAPQAAVNQILRLQVSNGTALDETVVLFNENATTGYDSYDASKMMNTGTGALNIYTKPATENLVLNSMPAIVYDMEIPVGMKLAAGTYTVSANEFSNFAEGTKVQLIDKLTGAVTNLNEGTYEFTLTEAMDNATRFALEFPRYNVATGIGNGNSDAVYVFAGNNRIVVNTAEIPQGTIMQVYNSVGQCLTTQAVNGSVNEIKGQFTPGVYLVKVNNVTAKVVMK